jgi:hypothetical protein
MIPLLPGSQERERLDEQSTANLQLQSSHVQAVFKRRKKKKEKKKLYNIIKKIALQSLQELIIKEESGKSKRIEAGHSRIHIFSGQSQDPTHGPSHSAIPKVMLL